jgi:SPP1 gp7 family putative phage head morphogenesis protein
MPSFLFTPTRNEAAIRFLKSKPAVSREVFDGLLPDLRARAFTVTGIESASLLKKLQNRIAELPAGADWDEVKGGIAESLSPYVGEDAAAARRRAETILRVNGYQAYAVGHYGVLQRQADVFPFLEYDTANDEKVRSSHASLDGKILPANHPFWRSHFPPWEFGCRCGVIARTADDVAEIEAADARKVPEARRVIQGERLDRLTRDGVLMTEENGLPRPVDVRSPREKFGGSGFAFDPSSLGLDLAELRSRYAEHPEVWKTFETWARRTEIPGQGRTVWAWLEKGAKV